MRFLHEKSILLCGSGNIEVNHLGSGRVNIFSAQNLISSVINLILRHKFNKFPLVCRGVDSYLPRFTLSHGQNIVDSRGASPSKSTTYFDHVME